MFFALALTALLVAVIIFIEQPKFGKVPAGERLERIKRSPHYQEGHFVNLSVTPDLTEGASYLSVMREFLFTRRPERKPVKPLPHMKTDLHHLDPAADVLVWFGHSSYFMQLDSKRILVDPVLSGSASPLAWTNRSFGGTDAYTVDDIPGIDYLFITHDHWDHLDYETVRALKPKVKTVICALGTGSHFEYWGYDKNAIIEKDWNERIDLDPGFVAYTAPARHFSGRGLRRNRTLWTAFVFQTPSMKIYIGGDSGYDTHFAATGAEHGPFDLAILENGQYDKSWKYIHMMPEEVLQAATDLKAAKLLPVHSGKFAMANHPWNEPLKRLTEQNKTMHIPLLTPVVGELVELRDTAHIYTSWWEHLQ